MGKKRYFVFVDESGNNAKDELFALGCLFVPVETIGNSYEAFNKIKSKIVSISKNKERLLLSSLNNEDKINFYKGRRRVYEIKFKNINQTTAEAYTWLVSEYFKHADLRFSCLVIDKRIYPNPKNMSFYDIYINQLVMLLKNTIRENEEIVLLADDITISGGKYNYEFDINKKLRKYNKNIFGTHRIESHSSIFIQLVDVLTGAVLYEFKGGSDKNKIKVVNKVKNKLGVNRLDVNLTIKTPNYFSVWKYEKKK